MLQNFLYLCKKKTQVSSSLHFSFRATFIFILFFPCFISSNFHFYLMNALVYVKSTYINIGNFEAFLRNLNLSANRLFWRCECTTCIGIFVLWCFFSSEFSYTCIEIYHFISSNRLFFCNQIKQWALALGQINNTPTKLSEHYYDSRF